MVLIDEIVGRILSAIPQLLVDGIAMLVSFVFNGVAPTLENQANVLLTYPAPVSMLYPMWIFVVQIIAMLSVVGFGLVGLYLLISGSGPADREKAKDMIEDIIFMAFLVSISYFLYLLLIELSSAIATSFWSFAGTTMTYRPSGSAEMVFFGLLYLIGAFLLNATLAFRSILLMAGVAFFPIGLALMRFPFTKNWGHVIVNTLFLLIFLPIADIIVIAVSAKAAVAMGGAAGDFVWMVSYYLVALINFNLMFSTFKKIGDAVGSSVVAPVYNIAVAPVKIIEKVKDRVT